MSASGKLPGIYAPVQKIMHTLAIRDGITELPYEKSIRIRIRIRIQHSPALGILADISGRIRDYQSVRRCPGRQVKGRGQKKEQARKQQSQSSHHNIMI